MKKEASRVVRHYFLGLDGKGKAIKPRMFFNLLDYIVKEEDKRKRIFEKKNDNRYIFLDEYHKGENSGDVHCLLFKRSRYNFSPPLVDRNDPKLAETENVKELTQGEAIRTHLAFKMSVSEGNFTIVLESQKAGDGITMSQIDTYLNHYCRKYAKDNTAVRDDGVTTDFSVFHEEVLKEDFLEELEKLNTIACADISAPLSFLDSTFGEYSGISDAKDLVRIHFSRKKSHNLKKFVKSAYSKVYSEFDGAARIKVEGYDDDNRKSMLNTDNLIKKKFISVLMDEMTGVPDSASVFEALKKLL